MGLGRLHQHAAELEGGLHELAGQVLCSEPRIGRHLVVTAAPGMEALARLADPSGELALDGHVDILIVHAERERAGLDILLDGVQAVANGQGIRIADDALARQHGRVRLGTGDVLAVEMLVNRERCPELLRRGCHADLEPASPKCHGRNPFSLPRPRRNAFGSCAGGNTVRYAQQ